MKECKHPEIDAWESFPQSNKNYNGLGRCRKCNKVIFIDEYFKYIFNVSNGVWPPGGAPLLDEFMKKYG